LKTFSLFWSENGQNWLGIIGRTKPEKYEKEVEKMVKTSVKAIIIVAITLLVSLASTIAVAAGPIPTMP